MSQTRNTLSYAKQKSSPKDTLSLSLTNNKHTLSLSRSHKNSRATLAPTRNSQLHMGEESDEPADLMTTWLNSRLNQLQHSVILSNRSFLWAWGDNRKRALSVQKQADQIEMPDFAAGSSVEADTIIQVACGQEHSAAVTDTGLVLVTGSNQH